MKFAETKKEQVQLIVLGVIVLGTLGYVGVKYGLKSVIESFGKSGDEAAAIDQKLHDAKVRMKEINFALKRDASVRSDHLEAVTKIDEICDAYVPRWGKAGAFYTMEPIIASYARQAGVDFGVPMERGQTGMPKIGKASPSFRGSNWQLTFEAGYEKLIEVVKVIESASPFVNISSVTISAAPQSPAKHRLTMAVQWPAWVEPRQADEIKAERERLAKEPPSAGPPGASAKAGATKQGAGA